MTADTSTGNTLATGTAANSFRRGIPLREGRRRLGRAQGSVPFVFGWSSGSTGQWFWGPQPEAHRVAWPVAICIGHRGEGST